MRIVLIQTGRHCEERSDEAISSGNVALGRRLEIASLRSQ
jgi:hypothetical protein